MLFCIQNHNFKNVPGSLPNLLFWSQFSLQLSYNEKRTEAREILPNLSPSYILRPFSQPANRNSLERSHTLLLLLSQILVNYTYKLVYRNSVNHASLFQRLHLRRRASNAVHSSAH